MAVDLCLFEGGNGRYRLCNRVWDGGPDRPDFIFMGEVSLAQAVILFQSGVADDQTPNLILEKAVPFKGEDRKKNKPRFRLKAGIRKHEQKS